MTAEELIAAGIPLSGKDALTVLRAEAALDWMLEYTTLEFSKNEVETLAALPSCAKLFVVKYGELLRTKQGVASESIEGMSQSFHESDQSALLWRLANTLLGQYIKSQVRVFPARRRW